MAVPIRNLVFLTLEAKSLAVGGRRNLVAGEWLYLREQIKPELSADEDELFTYYEEKIRSQFPESDYSFAA